METKAYEVVVVEVYRTTVLVEGTSKGDAISIVRDAYNRGYIDTNRDELKVDYETARVFDIPDVCPKCGKVHNPESRDFIEAEGRCTECYRSLIYTDL